MGQPYRLFRCAALAEEERRVKSAWQKPITRTPTRFRKSKNTRRLTNPTDRRFTGEVDMSKKIVAIMGSSRKMVTALPCLRNLLQNRERTLPEKAVC